MSPTVFRYRNYRFYFFSREEPRVHVMSPDGEAKFWMEPAVEVAVNKGLHSVELAELLRIVEERQNEIREHWRRHFGG